MELFSPKLKNLLCFRKNLQIQKIKNLFVEREILNISAKETSYLHFPL